MNPSNGALISDNFYERQLITHESCVNRPFSADFRHYSKDLPIIFYHRESRESIGEDGSTSWKNHEQVSIIQFKSLPLSRHPPCEACIS